MSGRNPRLDLIRPAGIFYVEHALQMDAVPLMIAMIRKSRVVEVHTNRSERDMVPRLDKMSLLCVHTSSIIRALLQTAKFHG